MSRVLRATLVLVSALALPAPASANGTRGASLRILVQGIDSDKGQIQCALFAQGRGFPGREAGVVQVRRYPAVAPMLTCTFAEVQPGRYAVAVSHDENDNQKIEADFEDGSEEAWGVTRNVRPGRRAPTFGEAAIYLSEGQPRDYEVLIAR